MIQPYFADNSVELYHGKMEDVLPELGSIYERFDACLTDPPYGETSLAWDRWPTGWPALVAKYTNSLWCFGSMRMFLAQHGDFTSAGWKLAQDVIWEKGNGSGVTTDRFRRVHEIATHWYSGPWGELCRNVPRVPAPGPEISHGKAGRAIRKNVVGMEHRGAYEARGYMDDGLRLMRSVIQAKNLRGRALHPTEKPQAVLTPLVEFSVPPAGLVLDPFAGSASTLLAARTLGRRAVGIEASEEYCERAAKRLSEVDLFTSA